MKYVYNSLNTYNTKNFIENYICPYGYSYLPNLQKSDLNGCVKQNSYNLFTTTPYICNCDCPNCPYKFKNNQKHFGICNCPFCPYKNKNLNINKRTCCGNY